MAELTTIVMFAFDLSSCTTVVSSEVATTLRSKLLMLMMRDNSLLADVPRFIRLNTSFRQFL